MGKTYKHLSLQERVVVQTELEQGLSPAAIAAGLKRDRSTIGRELRRNGWKPERLSREMIYAALYAMPRGQLRTRVLTLLRRAHKRRRKRSDGRDRRKSIPNMTLIDHRQEEVGQRLVPGHWEGDLIKGKLNRSQVGTPVERTTLYVALVKLPDGKKGHHRGRGLRQRPQPLRRPDAPVHDLRPGH